METFLTLDPNVANLLISSFKTLGVEPNSTLDVIKEAYVSLGMKYHPDKKTQESSEEKFNAVQQAYKMIKDFYYQNAEITPEMLPGIINNSREETSHVDNFATAREILIGEMFRKMQRPIIHEPGKIEEITLTKPPLKKYKRPLTLLDIYKSSRKPSTIRLKSMRRCKECVKKYPCKECKCTNPWRKTCKVCEGSGIVYSDSAECKECNLQKYVKTEICENINVLQNANIFEGAGNETNDTDIAGDVEIAFERIPDPIFKPAGNGGDLIATFKINIYELLTLTEYEFKFITGEIMKIPLTPPINLNYAYEVINAKGLLLGGKLYIKFEIIPYNIEKLKTEKYKHALEKL